MMDGAPGGFMILIVAAFGVILLVLGGARSAKPA